MPVRPLLLGLLMLAATLRFVDLEGAPPGFWYDEGLNGRFARDILAGDWRLFYGDREPLFFYPLAAVVALFGSSIFALRWLSAAAGLLTVAAIYPLGRRLLGTAGGVLAMAATTILFVHFGINRFAERVNLLPLFEILTCYWLWRSLYPRPDERPMRAALVAGVLGGLTLYTYLASRFFPFVLLLFLLWQLAADRPMLRKFGSSWLVVAGVAALVAAPLGIHYLRFPDDFFLRSSQVWPYAGLGPVDLGLALLGQLGVALAMFAGQGDANWRHNIAGRPAFDAVMAIALYAGIIRIALRRRRPSNALLGSWLLVMLLPSVLASDNPHFLRSFGALPAAILLAVYGAVWVAALTASSGLGRRGVIALGCGWFVWSGWNATSDYFGDWRSQPETLAAFEADVVDGARLINGLPADLPVYGSAWIRPHPAVEYLVGSGRVTWFGGRDGLVAGAVGEPSAVALFAKADTAGHLLGRTAAQVGRSVGPAGLPLFQLVQLPAGHRFEPGRTLSGQLGDLLAIDGLTVSALPDGSGIPTVQAGQLITVEVHSRILRPAGRNDLSLLLQLLDPNGAPIAQDDQLPYPSDRWRTGERLIVRFEIEPPSAAPRGVRTLGLGLYGADGDRFAALDGAGRPAGETVSLGSLKITGPLLPRSIGQELGRFGGSISLVEAQADRSACPAAPCRIELGLQWRADQRVEDDLRVFVHLAGPDGRPIAQSDGVPAGGLMPVAAWAPGEVVLDRRIIEVPPGANLGGTRLLVGLYRASNGERLTVVGGETFVVIP